MSELLSSAWSYLSGGGGGGEGGSGGSRFVGQEVDMGGGKVVKIKRVIAEGGYGYVFVAQDTQSGKEYALKRQVVDKDNIKAVKQEIAFLKQLRGHSHIIHLVGAAGSPPSHTSHGNAEFVILTELCSGGKMEDIVNTIRLTPRHVLRVFYQTCSAVAHLHSQSPPIIHRDLKVENLLLTTGGSIKLCDFGSATTEHVAPDHSWTATQRGLTDDEIQRNTTPMYRSPEMIDLYSNHPISEKADIWALGCLLYKLCYREHPFEDSAKLRILSANYKLPSDDTTYLMFHSIIRACLQVNPSDRPTVDSIVAQLYSTADKLRENLDQPSTELLTLTGSAPHTSNAAPPPTATPEEGHTEESNPGQVHAALHSTGQQAHKLLGFMKDGAGNLFKKLKDSSSTVVHQVASATHGSKRPSLDIAYITSRILVMSFPHEDNQHANSLWEVREFLETRHPSQYLVFNLSGHPYDTVQLNNQVADFAWPHKQMPDLEKMVDLCRNLDSWLRADKQNIIVLHCTDGRLISALVVTAYLLFLNAFDSPLVPLKLFTFKRSLDIQIISPSPSQLRYLNYICELVGSEAYKPHSTSVTITAIQMSSVPLFNAIKTGCKPFVEVFQNGERVFTSASHDTMDQIQSFSSDSGGVLVPLGTKVRGNVQVIIHHIRSIPIARKANLGMTAVRMFQFQFHTGFISPSSNTLTLERQELDGIVAKEDKFPSPFQVLLGLEWDRSGEPCSPGISWQNLPHPASSPLPAFSSLLEQEETIKQFCDTSVGPSVAFFPQHHYQGGHPNQGPTGERNGGRGKLSPQQPPEPATTTTAPPPPSQSAKDFFSQLDWQAGESGYTAFAGESESDSDESSSSSEEEENQEMFGSAPFGNTQTYHTPMPQLGLANGSSKSGGGVTHSTASSPGPTLIRFGSESDSDADDDHERGQPNFRPPPPTTISAPHRKSPFGDFDPWGTTATARSMNLLDLEDNLSPSDSEQSEVRTVGTEAFKKKSSSLRSSPTPDPGGFSNQFDPFGGGGGHRNSGGGYGGDLFGNPGAFGHSGSSESLLKPAPSSQPMHPGGSSLLTPNIGTNSLHSSAPNVSSLSSGNGALFTPTLSNIPQSPNTSSCSSGGARSMSVQQGNSGMSHGFPSGGGRTSPFRAGPNLMSGNSVLGHHSQSTGHLQQQTSGRGGGTRGSNRGDPFADLGNVKMGGGQSPTKQSHTSPQGGGPAMTSRSGYQYYNKKPSSAATAQSQTKHTGQTSKKPATGGQSGGGKTSSYQPNYSSSVLGGRSERGPRSKMGVRQPLKRDDFSDLLSSQGFSKPPPGPRTLKAMTKDSDIEGSIDPDRARVRDWAEGKERNIRALLSSLHTILWEGESRWSECGMHQLVQPDQVRKMFRKACLSVHPDKAQDTDHEILARAIFDELNDAYARFEESGAQPLY